MFRYLFSLLAAVILSLLFFACQDMVYSPKEENYADIKIPNTPISIDLDQAQDSVVLFGLATLNYTVDTKGKKFSKIALYIDSLYAGYTTDMNKTTCNTENYSSGSHKLKMEVWAYSGSGSLADKAGVEFLVSTKTWNILIDNREWTIPSEITELTQKNGTLEIKWERYPNTNFYNYEVYRARLDNSGKPVNYQKITTITDRGVTACTDNRFVGDSISYKVVVNTSKNTLTSKEKTFYDKHLEILSVTPVDQENLKITWQRPKYNMNIKKIKIFRYDYPNYNFKEITTLYTSVDTFYIDKAGFGIPETYYLCCYGDEESWTVSKQVSGYTGTFLTEDIESVNYVPENNSFYLTGSKRVDAQSMKVVATGTYYTYISHSGKRAVSNNYQRIPYEIPPHSFTSVDPLTMQPVSAPKYTDDLLGYYSINADMVLSETGLVYYLGEKYNEPTRYGPPTAQLVSLDPYKLLYKDSTYFPWGFTIISKMTDEGEYILSRGKMLNLNNGKLTKLYDAAGVFMPSGKEFIQVANGLASIYGCRDNSLIKSFPVKTGSAQVDPATGYLGIKTSDMKFIIYDSSSGNLLKEIQLAEVYDSDYLANSTLFSGAGYYIKLSYK